MLETNISLAPNRVNLPPSAGPMSASLKALWADGLTASQVAAELGGFEHCMDGGRSAVIGKVHRLHLPERSAPQRYPRIPRPKRDRAAADVNRGVTQRIVAKMLKVRHPENGGVEEVNIVIRDEGPPRGFSRYRVAEPGKTSLPVSPRRRRRHPNHILRPRKDEG
jgi:hypothetical protein